MRNRWLTFSWLGDSNMKVTVSAWSCAFTVMMSSFAAHLRIYREQKECHRSLRTSGSIGNRKSNVIVRCAPQDLSGTERVKHMKFEPPAIFLHMLWVSYKWCFGSTTEASVVDAWHFGRDPDPRIHTTDLRIRIRDPAFFRQLLKRCQPKSVFF